MTLFVDGDPSMPVNMKVLIECENASETLDTLEICRMVRTMALNEMEGST